MHKKLSIQESQPSVPIRYSYLCVYGAYKIRIRCAMLKEFVSNVDEIKIREMYVVVLSGNGSCKVLLYKNICIVLLSSEDSWCYIHSVGHNYVPGCATKNTLASETH